MTTDVTNSVTKKSAGRPVGSKDREPRTRRTQEEVGKALVERLKNASAFPDIALRGRPKGAKDKKPRKRRTKKTL